MKSIQCLTQLKRKSKIKFVLFLFFSIIFNTFIASAAIADDINIESKLTGGNWWGNLVMEITNNGTQPVDGWKLEFDFPFEVQTPEVQ